MDKSFIPFVAPVSLTLDAGEHGTLKKTLYAQTQTEHNTPLKLMSLWNMDVAILENKSGYSHNTETINLIKLKIDKQAFTI